MSNNFLSSISVIMIIIIYMLIAILIVTNWQLSILIIILFFIHLISEDKYLFISRSIVIRKTSDVEIIKYMNSMFENKIWNPWESNIIEKNNKINPFHRMELTVSYRKWIHIIHREFIPFKDLDVSYITNFQSNHNYSMQIHENRGIEMYELEGDNNSIGDVTITCIMSGNNNLISKIIGKFINIDYKLGCKIENDLRELERGVLYRKIYQLNGSQEN